MQKFIRSVISLLENQAASQGISTEIVFNEKLPKIMADREQIRQVILNLGINALQSMADGGKLTFRSLERDGLCVVEIEDTGGGIDEKILPKIFDPFFTTKAEGIGLGLSIAHKIASQHHGRLKIYRGSRGSIFALELPVDGKTRN